MAAPVEVSMQSLEGSWTLSKTLSGEFEPIFVIQGLPWVLRKAIKKATLQLKTAHDVHESGERVLVFTHIASILIAGLSEEKEVRVLDGREKIYSSPLGGSSSARSRMVNLATAKGHDGKPLDPVLIQDFLDEGEPGGDNNLYDLIIHQTKGWVMEQVWGFAIVNGERRFIRSLVITKGDQKAYTRGVYDWNGNEDRE